MGDKKPEARTPRSSPPKSPSKSPPGVSGDSAPAEQHTAGEAPTTSSGIFPPQHWADTALNDDSDGDSAIEDTESSTASLSSSVLQYRTIHGRSYHSDRGNSQYWGANDDAQIESLDINHHNLTLGIGGKLYLAPLDKNKVQKVLDVGTGTGIWAIDFADDFPAAEVIGTDISPIQPSWLPPNVRFEIDDCNLAWTYDDDSIDFIHMRWLVGSIPNWTALFEQAYRCCRPGGWVESFEPSAMLTSDDGSVHEDSALRQWGKIFTEGGRKLGLAFTVFEDAIQKKAMQDAGFINIEEFNFKNPLGEWPKDPELKEMGKYGKYCLEVDIPGYVLFMAHTLGWSESEIHVYVAHFRRELRSDKIHSYYKQRVVWGQKPV